MKLRLVLSCILGLAALVAAACSSDDAETTSTTTTSTTSAPVTSIQAAESTTTSAAPSTSATTTSVDPPRDPSLPEYTIVFREAGDDGDTVVVLLDDAGGSLTDIDLQNIVIDVVDRFPPILTAHIVADAAAADAVLVAAPTDTEQELMDRHYYVRLEEGFRLVFTGPFADTPTTILGS